MATEAQALHAESIIIDSTCPLLEDDTHLGLYQRGGFTAVTPTVGGMHGGSAETLLRLAYWHRVIRERDDLVLVRTADDIRNAKKTGKTGLILHFQGTEPLDRTVDLLDVYNALGVKVIQLTYNKRCHVGDGCEEPSDSGLSRYGKSVVKRMNDLGIIVDCSHTGVRTSLDAIDASTAPVILSHANPKAVYSVHRNASDELLRAIASSGGVIGIVGYPAFVSSDKRPTLDQYIDHIAYLADQVGIDHVGLGIDYFGGQHGICPEDVALAAYERKIALHIWSRETYPAPPYYYPEGIETPDKMLALTERMLARGFSAAEVKQVLGENWLNVYAKVWKDSGESK
ncbi:dipeptidase [Burkholderia arboris]|uniref:dipeptidase n=1 Tax=Burkholderia arboris TaxID=488730 RepID=UPI001CF11C93|nr:dipeptidase [Burkholderia arboris]MCA8052360.1 dipeptidase [Burkholderia arboris]